MAGEYGSTTQELFALSQQAIGLASLSAGRINLSTKPNLKETGFSYQVPTLSVGAPPQFSDLFNGSDNASANIAALNGQVDDWMAKYFPSINGSFSTIPEDWLANVISGVQPFGIDSSIFDLVWHRARDRAYRTVASEQRTLEANFSARGFSLPPGALVAQLAQSERRAADALLDVNREQAIQDAQIKNDLLKMAVQVSAQLKTGILNTAADFFRAWHSVYQLDADTSRIRAQAYQAFYQALGSYYDVEVSMERLKLQAAEGKAQADNQIDRNRIGVFASDGAAPSQAQASRGFADIASSAANAAGSLVAHIEQGA